MARFNTVMAEKRNTTNRKKRGKHAADEQTGRPGKKAQKSKQAVALVRVVQET